MAKDCYCNRDVAALIKDYLKRHPDSEDTISGITNWWLKQQRFDDSMIMVDSALKALELDGEVSSVYRNNQVYFRLAKNN